MTFTESGVSGDGDESPREVVSDMYREMQRRAAAGRQKSAELPSERASMGETELRAEKQN